ncbi:MAG: hypothetical protein GC181_05595 [Bacteroidetes bacterium]|nr:hypothetical protein [Bacteroidota bacterium]
MILFLAAVLVYYKDTGRLDYQNIKLESDIVERTFVNYSENAVTTGKKYNVPPEYLLALIALESSGRKMVPKRFEPSVYDKLDLVSRSKLARMENVDYAKIKGMTSKELYDLSCSWGPFQIMGYKCFELNVPVDVLKGKRNFDLSVKWIAQEYGNQLRSGNFKDAFHIHNTGRSYPKFGPPRTYHLNYVPTGLKFMEEFSSRLSQTN